MIPRGDELLKSEAQTWTRLSRLSMLVRGCEGREALASPGEMLLAGWTASDAESDLSAAAAANNLAVLAGAPGSFVSGRQSGVKESAGQDEPDESEREEANHLRFRSRVKQGLEVEPGLRQLGTPKADPNRERDHETESERGN